MGGCPHFTVHMAVVQALYSIEPRGTSRAYGQLEALQSALPNKPGRLYDDVRPSDLQR
jgi:hypothetical protein